MNHIVEAMMYRAKAFFFVCTGLFLLAIAYNLGAGSAKAQAGLGTIEVPSFNGGWACGVRGRTVYNAPATVSQPFAVQTISGVPGNAPIIAASSGGNVVMIMLDDGDIYQGDLESSSWQYVGNLLTSATPTTASTWGTLKARYRKSMVLGVEGRP